MKNRATFILATGIIFLYSCGNGGSKENETTPAVAGNDIGKIEIYDMAAAGLLDSLAVPEIIGRGYTWSEGPVWIADKKMLLFTDVPENKIFQWKEGDSAKLYLTPSGYTQSVKRIGGEDGANGLALDKQGNLLLCQSGNRQVVRMNAPVDAPKPDFTILAPDYKGKKFNSPNDLIIDRNGNIYFTDPIYGLPQREKDSTRELKFEGVYKISTDGKTTLLIDSIQNPNGIALSPDEKILYVATSHEKHPGWYAYQLDAAGNPASGGLLLDGTGLIQKAAVKQGADGFKIDKAGNIFSAGPDGINIISPAGKLLALIKIYQRKTSNCAFNETKDILFITADDVVLRLKLH